MHYDVLIVGGGPAGSMAGIQLIGSGLRVAILDRAHFPRLKPCGGGISCRAFRRFAYIDAVMRSVPTNYVTRVVFESPAGDAVEFSTGQALYAMIRRVEFDNALLDHCRQNGIEVREDVTVSKLEIRPDGAHITSTTGEQFSADLVIGADGVNSTVAVQSGLRGPWHSSHMAIDGTEESPLTHITVRPDTMYIYFGVGAGYGYGYIFPKATHVNFGVGYQLDYFKQNVTQKPYEQHLRFMADWQQRGVISGTSQRENFHAWVLPIGGPLACVSTSRVLLAGDAGGFVNGFTAEGIYYAMVSGEHAGRAALDAIRARSTSGAFLSRYDRSVDAEIGRELRQSVALQKRLLDNPELINTVVRFAAGSTAARRLLSLFGVGEISYGELKRRCITQALPAYLQYQAEKLANRLRGSKSAAARV